jgi:glycosyltransferase involved in cell wall biosynthesis
VSNSRISVVIPLFNKARYIYRAIHSVLVQTFQDFEVVIVNDGSTDEGPAIVKQVQDPRIRMIEQQNAGVSAARNRGISESRAELIAFLDADDEWLEDFLETILELASRYPDAGAYCTGYLLVKDGKTVYRKAAVKEGHEKCECYFDLLTDGANIWTSTIVVRHDVFNRAGTFREGYRLGEDMDMWFRIGLYYTYACSPKICALYYFNQPDSACSIAVPDSVPPLYLSLRELRENANVSPDVKSKAIKHLSLDLAKDIRHVFLKGCRGIAQHRLQLYKEHFGANLQYIILCVIHIIPPFLLNRIAVLRSKLARYILTLSMLWTGHNQSLS